MQFVTWIITHKRAPVRRAWSGAAVRRFPTSWSCCGAVRLARFSNTVPGVISNENADRARPPAPEPGLTTRRVLGYAAAIAALITGLLFLWHARDVLLLVFAGVLVGIFLRRLATLISDHTPVPTSVALALVVLGITGALVSAFWLQGDRIAVEARQLREDLPQAVERLRDRVAGYELGEDLLEQLPEDPASLLPDQPDAVARVSGVLSSTFGVLTSGVVILFLGILLAATPGVYVGGVLALVPERQVPRGREVLEQVNDTLWWWLVGRLIAMTFIGVATGIGLTLLGVPLAFILALLAALLSFIPNLGPILAALPAILLALGQGPQAMLWVAALYAGVQAVESYLLDPIIDRKTIYLPPAFTVTAQLIMALFAGLLGVTLATPLAAALVVLVTMLYVQDVLGRRDISVQSH
jgi:predicted PurR-regulated permease PerM